MKKKSKSGLNRTLIVYFIRFLHGLTFFELRKLMIGIHRTSADLLKR